MEASINTSANGIHSYVNTLNFDKLKWKLCESSEAEMTKEECALAEQEYRRYLTLKLLHPKDILVPNKLVDKFWHAHILDTRSYRDDCDSVFGFYLDHFPYFGIYGKDDNENLESAFTNTKANYERHFGQYPSQLANATRCSGHACHAPSTCACRTPGACK
ncbi:glycine-rich domain-containing protein [Moritella dasanensis]|uniref:glycine-rich domain-containing protein n=1 Tax=Moritella dasanensis TaxID=428031 RepID=UPI0002F9A7CA|nr:hypothetical protein [Moritella dasanensis]